jgi:hypothetical protein
VVVVTAATKNPPAQAKPTRQALPQAHQAIIVQDKDNNSMPDLACRLDKSSDDEDSDSDDDDDSLPNLACKPYNSSDDEDSKSDDDNDSIPNLLCRPHKDSSDDDDSSMPSLLDPHRCSSNYEDEHDSDDKDNLEPKFGRTLLCTFRKKIPTDAFKMKT